MKRVFAFVLAAALLLSFAGCQNTESKPQTPGFAPLVMTPGVTHTDYDGMEIRIDSLNWQEEEKKTELVVAWNNQTGHDVIYGAGYVIERLEGENWVSCLMRDDVSFIAIAYEIKPGQSRKESYNLTDIYDVSSPGTYRFRTNCHVYAHDTGIECELIAQFTVVNGTAPEKTVKISTGVDATAYSVTQVQFCAQHIRTNGGGEIVEFPGVQIIKSTQDLKDYYTTYKDIFNLERTEKIYSDTTIGFLDACDRYDAAFFEKNFLIFVLLEEDSGSVRHEVCGVEQAADQTLSVYIDSNLPSGAGTCDMAQWHIILEISREIKVETAEDILVYLDGNLVFSGGTVVRPVPQAAFKQPPEGFLRTPEGDITLRAVGYNWTYENPDGTALATITDQLARPLPKEFLDSVTIADEFAETVYAYVSPGKYEPTNSLGYFVKLAWETQPTSVVFTCWPDSVWVDADIREETVVSHEGAAFYAKHGGYIYEITATWEDTGVGYYGTANYYVYILGGADHAHQVASEAQTVDDPVTGYCGNTWTTLYVGEKTYTFMYGHSVTLTDILVNLNYDPMRVCRCRPEYTVDTEFGKGYGINLTAGYARCEKGQADLTQEQINTIAQIIQWAETTNGEYYLTNS